MNIIDPKQEMKVNDISRNLEMLNTSKRGVFSFAARKYSMFS